MPRVLRRLSQMTNTVQKTTELILFGPLPSAYTLSSSKEEQENAEAETEADDTTIAHDSKLFPPNCILYRLHIPTKVSQETKIISPLIRSSENFLLSVVSTRNAQEP